MTRKLTKRWMALAVAVAMVLSPLVATAGAQWTAWNPDAEPEPDTGNAAEDLGDYDSDYMHQGPASSDSEIYFDAILDKNSFPFVTSPNAYADTELGTVDTDLRNFGISYFHAMLGYWQDCNGDGFIGLEETGQTHYLEDLADTNNCSLGPHYDGTHVTEFLPIGPEAKEVDLQDDTVVDVSLQGHSQAVQDHFAKVWHDWGFPGDDPAETRLLFPLPKGTFADSNGAFQYVDSLTFGSLSGTAAGTDCFTTVSPPTGHSDACALWPAGQSNTADDRAQPRQCNQDAADGTLGAGTASGYADNVVTGSGADSDPQNDCGGPGESPVPNVKTVDLGVAQVDWPANIAKERYNSSDDPDRQGQTVTEPVECDSSSGVSLAGWVTDPQAAVEDGDALEGYDGSNEDDYVRSYLSGDDGPSVIPTVDKVYGPVVFELSQSAVGQELGDLALSSEDCYEASQPAPNTLVLQDTPPVPEKTEADTTFSYFQDDHVEVSGTSSPLDTQFCVPTDSALFTHVNKCAGHWYSNSQWFHSHGLTTLNATGPLASFEATFYADVSGGDDHADGVLDDFNALAPNSQADLYAENDSTLVNGLWSSPFSPDGDVPAGELNAHIYGEHACYVGGDGTAAIDGDTTDPGNHSASDLSDLNAPADLWSCERDDWVAAADRPTDTSQWNDEAIQAVYLTPKVGDYYDLRDLECQDNDVAGTETTSENGPLDGTGPFIGGTDCESLSQSDERIPT